METRCILLFSNHNIGAWSPKSTKVEKTFSDQQNLCSSTVLSPKLTVSKFTFPAQEKYYGQTFFAKSTQSSARSHIMDIKNENYDHFTSLKSKYWSAHSENEKN